MRAFKLKLLFLFTLSFSLINTFNCVTVCGHTYGFPNEGPLSGITLTAFLTKDYSEEGVIKVGSTVSSETGSFCFENLTPSYYITVVAEDDQRGLRKTQSPTIQLPESGCLFPELNFQIPTVVLLRSVMALNTAAGTGAIWTTGCFGVTTVTRPCQGMYTEHSHGLYGTRVKLLRKIGPSWFEVDDKDVPKWYMGVTHLNFPKLPDSTCFVKDPFKLFCSQPTSYLPPSSWDGGIGYFNLRKGSLYKVVTECIGGIEECPDGTVFNEVFLNCQGFPELEGFELINASPPYGPRPISGRLCDGLGIDCGAHVPDPINKNPSNVWRKELREKCNMTDQDLLDRMGNCENSEDIRFKKLQPGRKNGVYWVNYDQFVKNSVERKNLH